MRPLVIDQSAKAKVAEVEEFAFSNWYYPGRSENPPGDDPRHVLELNTYRCVFSYTMSPHGDLYRHLSVSVPSEKYPNPFAVFVIAELFGFTGWDGKTIDYPADWEAGVNKTEHCVVVVQKIPEPQKRK
jgi:hypothetical protein